MVNPDVVTTRVVPIGQTVAIILNTPASTNTGIPTNGVWVIAGVHGDEPVPPYALFTRWRSFSWQTPTVVIPFANPSTLVAPSRTKRYGLGFDGGVAGNEEFWAGVESVAAQFVVPRLVLDLHEDGDVPRRLGGAYVYHHGNHLELPFNLVELWLGLGVPVLRRWVTRFGEPVVGGVVVGGDDESIDERFRQQFGSEVLVVESPTQGMTVDARRFVHTVAVDSIPYLWKTLNSG